MPLPFLFPRDLIESDGANETSDILSDESAAVPTSTAVPAFPEYLSIEEELQINQQFQNTWRWNKQVMWTGLYREDAQAWADTHDMVTLTSAMGPLMNPEHPQCLKDSKSDKAWSKYVKGASAIFASYILRGEQVVLLSPPPPERFHPSGQTNYQAIEEPILKRIKGGGGMLRIENVHPMIGGAEDFIYQMWPIDMSDTWIQRFGKLVQKARCWRKVKGFSEKDQTGYDLKREAQSEVIGVTGEAKLVEDARDVKKKAVLKKEARLRKEVVLKREAALKGEAAPKKGPALKKKAALKDDAALKKEGAVKRKAELKDRLKKNAALQGQKIKVEEEQQREADEALEKQIALLTMEALKEKRLLGGKAASERAIRLQRRNALKEKVAQNQKSKLKGNSRFNEKTSQKEKGKLEWQRAWGMEQIMMRILALKLEKGTEGEGSTRAEASVNRKAESKKKKTLAGRTFREKNIN